MSPVDAQRARLLVRPTLDTKFHIDFDWWERADRELEVYLRSHLCPEHQETYRDLDAGEVLEVLCTDPGALHDILSVLASRGINLTRIESRPVKSEPGKYLFFIDMLGHMEDAHISDALEDLRPCCSLLEWLGSYPVAEDDPARSI